MFETTKIIMVNNLRNLISKLKENPILYFFFIIMIISSIFLFSSMTVYFLMVETALKLNIQQIFFMVFFLFILKSSVDFYNLFIKSKVLTYALSTNVYHKKTVMEIFFAVLLTNILIWFCFSTLYIFAIFMLEINVNYPVLYILFNFGIISAICIGCGICVTFFSRIRQRIIPMILLLLVFLILQDPIFITLILPLSILFMIWGFNYSDEAYQNIRRKERINQPSQFKTKGIFRAIFYKETTIFWRDRLLISFILTSAFTGFGTGYLYIYGRELFFPSSYGSIYPNFLPSMFIFIGVFIVVVYTAVFPTLILFLNEEKTFWILRHVPIESQTLILGKISSLILCFITGLAFIPFIIIYVGFENLIYIIWFQIFAYLLSVIITLPISVRYVGKKSDILLLYSVTMLLLFILGISQFIISYIWNDLQYYLLPIMILFLEFIALSVSVKISNNFFSFREKKSFS